MKARSLILASVLLAGCQAPNHALTPYPSTQESSVRHDAPSSSSRSADEQLAQKNVWDVIGQEMKLKVPNNQRIRSQKSRYLRSKSHLQRVAERSEPYLYWIVEEVKKRNMPMEIALLPMVESAFDPNALSSANAAGLWQITSATGRRFGLDQNWWYDGRRDVGASTRAALDLLQRLNTMFDGDWMMTLAAYNAGEGRIQKAIKANRAQGKPTDYWSLNLPRETAVYVPKILALSDIIRHADRYALKLPHIDKSTALARVNVGQQFDLKTAAEVVGMSVSDLRTLNPAYKKLATAPSGPHYLMLPKQKAKDFKAALRENSDDLTTQVVRHKVQAGESIEVLARRFTVSAIDIKQLNKLNGAGIRKGQYILLPVSQSQYLSKNRRSGMQSTSQAGNDTHIASKSASGKSYKVKSGDTLSAIAQRYKMSSSELAKLNNISLRSPLKLGQVLKVTGKAGVATEIAYRARKGDSLYSIAQRHGVAVDDLVRWNALSHKSVLKPGTVLTVKVKS